MRAPSRDAPVMVASLGRDHPRAAAASPLFETELPASQLLHRGKVRDIYAIDDDHMLIVTTDRLSAFDVVLPDPIPGKGRVLHAISLFWFERTAPLVRQSSDRRPLDSLIRDPPELAHARGPRR